METETLRNILALSLIKGIGAASIKKSLAFVEAFASDWKKLAKMSKKVNAEKLAENFAKAEEIIATCAASNIQLLSIIDAQYPAHLRQLHDAPPILYAKGNLTLLQRVVGITGTQESTALGNAIAQKLGEYFTEQWSICVGLHAGIEQQAIRTKEGEVRKGIIGIVSAGFHDPAVTGSTTTQIIANDGLLLSEFEPNKSADLYAWNKTSRIQAGISQAMILVQSPLGGSSKYPLKAYAQFARPLGIIAFPSNREYLNHAVFAANRLILEKQKAGLMEFCGIKKVDQVISNEFIAIQHKEDYLKIKI